MDTFLNKIAKELVTQFGSNLLNVTIVLPNKRSKVFLLNEIQNQIETSVFAPSILSIQEFTENVSGIRSIDAIEQLFELFNVYTQISPLAERQSFNQFAPWAKVVLKDFDEIDAYLIQPEKILNYLKEIKDIEHWSLSDKRTALIEKHLKFWSFLPELYHNFYKHLLSNNIGYQGLILKEATYKIASFFSKNSKQKFVFVGFNALSPAEQKIIQYLLTENQAKIYWDIDKAFIDDSYNLAAYNIQKYKKSWSYYSSNLFEWVLDEFSKDKNIHIIRTPKAVGQAKIVGQILEESLEQNPDAIDKTALVLSEKSLLLPILYSLGDTVSNLNITLGYSAKNNPSQFLINRLFKMHIYAKSRKGESYYFYYKDVLEVLSHPFVNSLFNASKTIEVIKQNNITFISSDKLFELQEEQNDLFRLVFSKWSDHPIEILDTLSDFLLILKDNLSHLTDSQKVTKAFVFELYKIINRLKNYFAKSPNLVDINNLYAIYNQIIDSAEVSFEGEPLAGLQIMGILESRTLDFENVIITSVNEGKIPFGKSSNSLIPFDVKKEFGLPTYKDRDAIYTYHFYRLLQRAKNIYLIYNTDDQGMDAAEKSRFITQLKLENLPNHQLTDEFYNSYLPTAALDVKSIEKSDKVMRILKAISEKGFSPSSLALYIRNPLEFYYQRILKIDQNKEVEENIEANTLGNVIHATLDSLFRPYLNKYLSQQDLEYIEQEYPNVLAEKFREEFKQGDINKGKNLLTFESAKRSISNYLNTEKQSITEGDVIKILSLEEKFDRILEDSRLPFPIKITGNIDRIEQRNGVIRIVDYKTGRVEKSNLKLQNWEDFLAKPQKNKIIQLLSYVFMYQEKADNLPIETGIISFKNLKNGFMPFEFEYSRSEVQRYVTDEIIEEFKSQTIGLLLEILNQDIPFNEAQIKN